MIIFPFNILFWSSDYFFLLNSYNYIRSIYYFSSLIIMLKYKYLCKISHGSFTTLHTCFSIYSLNINFQPSDFSVPVFSFIHWISLFDHQNIKRQPFIFFINFNMVSLLHINWTLFYQVMCFAFQWFQFLTLLLFHLFFNHINNNDQQSSTFSIYSFGVWKGGYQPLWYGSVEKWENE